MGTEMEEEERRSRESGREREIERECGSKTREGDVRSLLSTCRRNSYIDETILANLIGQPHSYLSYLKFYQYQKNWCLKKNEEGKTACKISSKG